MAFTKDYIYYFKNAKMNESGTAFIINVDYLVQNLPTNIAAFERKCYKSNSWIHNIKRTGLASGPSVKLLIDHLGLDKRKLLIYEEETEKPEEPDNDQKYAIADALDSINATLQAINDRLYELLKTWEG